MAFQPAIIPLPAKCTFGKGSFLISDQLTISTDKFNQINLIWLQKILHNSLNFEASLVPEDGQVQMRLDSSLSGLGEEGYQLNYHC